MVYELYWASGAVLEHLEATSGDTFNLYHNQRDTLHTGQILEVHFPDRAHGTCQTDYKTHNREEVHSLLFELYNEEDQDR